MSCHEGDGTIEPKWRVLQILKDIQVEHPVRLCFDAITCTLGALNIITNGSIILIAKILHTEVLSQT